MDGENFLANTICSNENTRDIDDVVEYISCCCCCRYCIITWRLPKHVQNCCRYWRWCCCCCCCCCWRLRLLILSSPNVKARSTRQSHAVPTEPTPWPGATSTASLRCCGAWKTRSLPGKGFAPAPNAPPSRNATHGAPDARSTPCTPPARRKHARARGGVYS